MTSHSDLKAELGAGLKQLRLAAELSTNQVASATGMSQSKVSRAERGINALPPRDVTKWVIATKASPREGERLVIIAEQLASQLTEWRQELAPGRVRLQQQIARLEETATVNREFSHDVIPGLAQTAGYALGIFQLGTHKDLGPEDETLADIVAARLARQTVLEDPAKRFFLLMSETAVRRRLVDATAMVEQLERLIELTQRPNVTLGVIPFAGPEAVHQYHSFAIIGEPSDESGRDALVLAETVTRPLRIHDQEEIRDYINHFNELRQGAIEGEAIVPWLMEVITGATSS